MMGCSEAAASGIDNNHTQNNQYGEDNPHPFKGAFGLSMEEK